MNGYASDCLRLCQICHDLMFLVQHLMFAIDQHAGACLLVDTIGVFTDLVLFALDAVICKHTLCLQYCALDPAAPCRATCSVFVS